MVDNFHFNKFRIEFFKILGFVCLTPLGLTFIEIIVYANKNFTDYINAQGLFLIISIMCGLTCLSKAIETCEIMDEGEKIINGT